MFGLRGSFEGVRNYTPGKAEGFCAGVIRLGYVAVRSSSESAKIVSRQGLSGLIGGLEKLSGLV
jgi:hypothetical protein